MKLRIKGNSLRLRISQTEMRSLLADGAIADTICFGLAPEARLSYALKHRAADKQICVEYAAQTVSVVLSTRAATAWAQGDEVGIYGSAATANGPLELIVEKDYACLDGSDPVDRDAFPHPQAGVC
jgi:hypothetical protein